MDMGVILSQMGILVFMMAVGFICAKLKVTGQEFTRSASTVTINVTMLFTIIASVMNTGLDMSALELGVITAQMFVIFIVSGVFGALTGAFIRRRGGDGAVTFVTITFMNTVFVAFPIIEFLYGAQGLFYASLSNIPFNLGLYSVGTLALSGGGKGGAVSFRRMMSPPLIATLIAIAIMLTGVRVPEVVKTAFVTIGRATVPLGMLIIGTSLGMAPLRDVVKGWDVYAIMLVRLVLCPVAVWAVGRLMVSDPVVLGTLVILAAAPCPMIITPLSIQYGRDAVFASQGVFLSTLLSAVTMPLIIWILL